MKKNMIKTLAFTGLLAAAAGSAMFWRSVEPVQAQKEKPLISINAETPSLLENLGRGLIAVRRNSGEVYIGWRLLGGDAADVSFNLYRSTAGGQAVKLNDTPITQTTDYVDAGADLTQTNSYFVRPIVNNVEQAAGNTFALNANAPTQQFLSVPLQRPAGGTTTQPGTTVGSANFTYSANDASVGDADGDGTYEIFLKWDPSNSRDTASAGLSAPVLFDAYKLDGTRLWRIDLGKNIRAGAHYTQFLVYDFDGDGKAELICKTADGTVDGVGNVIGDATKDYRTLTVPTDSSILATATNDARFGKILDGPEYLTVFNGETGAAMATVNYVPGRLPLDSWGGNGGNGGNDSTGNRVDRFLATPAYLDGVRPSAVMCRGYYGRSVLAAWDWRNNQLTQRWVFDSVNRANPFSGQGAHSVSVADVDNDGKDEIVYHSMVVDDNGTGLFSTGLRHGDALHVSDLNPARPGLEVFGVHETEATTNPAYQSPGSALYDARTGEILWSNNPATDAGRGVCADIDPNYLGAECWGAPGGTRNVVTGNPLYTQSPSSTNFAVWWDADLSRELEDGTSITKWNPTTLTTGTLLSATGTASNNGTKSNPSLLADLFGDWREEVMWRDTNSTALRIYTTTIPANNRFYTLMQNRQYREAIAWQNVGYNQPPHPSFYLGNGMSAQPQPNIFTSFIAATNAVSGNFRQNNVITYTITLTNNGIFDQLNNPGDEFVDVLPPELTLVSAEASSGVITVQPDNKTVTWNGGIPALQQSKSLVGENTVTITIRARINLGLPVGTIVFNQGRINYDSDGNGTNELTGVTDDPNVVGNNNATGVPVLVPTAANVHISGRVLNSQNRIVKAARVTLLDEAGRSRSVLTNLKGEFIFNGVEAGQTYNLSAAAKGYVYESQSITPNDNIEEVIFTPTN